eukprot:TCONS_00063669-protein
MANPIQHNEINCNQQENGNLCEAAAFGDIKTIKYLVKKQGIDVNTAEEISGSTPLIWSIINSKVKVAKLLLRMGADIHSGSFNEKTAFDWAEANNDSKMLSLLQKNEASKTTFKLLPNILRKLGIGHGGQKALKSPTDSIHTAAGRRNNYTLKTLLKENSEDINTKNTKGDSPLHTAIKSHRISTTKFLLVSGADMSVRDEEGFLPLHVAVINNKNKKCDEILKNMVMRGADIMVRDASGRNALDMAFLNDDLRSVKIICKSLPPNTTHLLDVFGHAIGNDSVELMQLLLKRWPRGVKDEDGNSLLHMAILKGNFEMVSEVVNTFDVSTTNNNGDTPLHLAVSKRLNEIVCLLLHNNADVNMQNNQGETPLHTAVQSNLLIFILLVDKCDNTLQNHDGDTVFHLAARHGKTDFIDLMVKENKPSNDPYSSNHDVSKTSQFKNILNHRNCTALHEACFGNHYKTVEKLLDIDIESDIKNCEGKTALDIAISMDHLSLVCLFKGQKLCGNGLATFLCTVCYEIPTSPNFIYKCPNGHIYCSACDTKDKFLQCPQCGIPIRKKLRNKDAEEKLAVMFPNAAVEGRVDSFECLFQY